MPTPSPIYQSTVDSKQRLYYRPPGSDALSQILNPEELQNLAKQGMVEVGKPYQPYTPPAPVASSSPIVPGASAPTAPVDSRTVTEVKPGVFSSSKLTDFYNNQIELMKPSFEAAQKALQGVSTELGTMKTPDAKGTYETEYVAKVQPLDQTISDRSAKLNALDSNIRSLEDAVRTEIGGRASEASIQAEVARRAKPLLLQRQTFVDELTTLGNQRESALSSIQQGITFQQQDFQNRSVLLENQRNLAQSTLDSFASLVEKGASATDKDVDNFRQTFTSLLSQAPDVLKSLTDEEYQQLQAGYVPYSVMTKIGETINEQKLASQPKIFGSAASGYWTLGKDGKPEQLVAPGAGGTGGLTPSQRLNAAIRLMAADPTLPDIDAALAQVDQQIGATTGGRPTPTDTSGAPSRVNVGGFDISTYATDPNHEAAVQTILNRIGQFGSVAEMDAYIQQVAPGSPITGQMVANASQQNQIPWEMLVAMMQQDSNLGTAGKGAKTFNPGNVGNDDAGNLRNYGSWQSGVNAVGDWLSKHRASEGQDFVTDYTNRAQTVMSSAPKDARNAAIRQVSTLVRDGKVEEADRYLNSLAYNQLEAAAKTTFDENANAIASLQIASQLANDPTLSAGPYKALFESKKPYSLIQRDPKYANFRVFTDIGQAQLRRAFFGTAVTATEQDAAAGFLINPTDDMLTIKAKLVQLPKILQFANDAKVARVMGTAAPKLTDYVSMTEFSGGGGVANVLSDLGY